MKARFVALFMAAAVIVPFEGYRRLDYLDPVGIPTACFGRTTGAEVGTTRTESECVGMLVEDLQHYQTCLLSAVNVKLDDHQLAALTSWTYNVGCGAMKSSTLVLKLNAGDYVGACNQLPRWVYARGFKLNGLIIRRESERRLCLAQA